MQRLFVSRFFVTRKDVTLADLSNLRQRPRETVDAFIDRWQTEASRCRVHLSEQVQLCRNGIRSDISILVNEQITSFRASANEACPKERTLALRAEEARKRESLIKTKKKEKGGTSTNVTEVKSNTGDAKPKVSNARSSSQRGQQSFGAEDVIPIFQALMHKGAIELPPIKYLEEVGREDDPKYCHFHRGINHPTSQCYQLRRIIQDCIDKGIVRPKNATNAYSKKIYVSTEEVTRKRGRKKSSTEDEARDFVCTKDLPDVSRILTRRRNGKIRKKKLQRERQERG